MKKKFLLFTLSFLYIICESNYFKPEDDEEIKRLMDDLMRKKNEYSDKNGEVEIYQVFITVLIGTIIFFIIIILSCAIYEIINCYLERKREIERKELIVKNIQKSKNVKNFSLKLSNGSSSSTEDDKKAAKVENSFHSSNMSSSIREKEDYNKNSNNVIEKSNIEDSYGSRPRINSGNEAPIIKDVVKEKDNEPYYNNNMQQKLLTNKGNEENEGNMKNPYGN